MPSATRRVAVIGAGISGVAAAAHLRKENVDVVVYERSSAAGGVWLYDERKPLEPAYPAALPSQAGGTFDQNTDKDVLYEQLLHAPPGPCYIGLKNNVGTRMLETTLNRFPEGTEDFVTHKELNDYIQDTSVKTGVHDITQYDTQVRNVTKKNGKWLVEAITLRVDKAGIASRHEFVSDFDAVVVASGHYHAAKVPDTPGLSDWKRAWPDRIAHSKAYRTPEHYRGQNVLLVGGSVSATDIARELGPVADKIYQSHRNGTFDLPASLLPEQIIRVDEVTSYNDAPSTPSSIPLPATSPIPATLRLKSGHQLCDIHHVILCTGYQMTLPFLAQHHADTLPAAHAPDTVLVTDGTQFHNLHKDIFYIPDPSLAFVGVPFFTATFSLFDFQAQVVAKVLAGQVRLPARDAMRAEYVERVRRKGVGKAFHSLRDQEHEYVDELLEWVNADLVESGAARVSGHTETWHRAREEQVARMKAMFEAPGVVQRELEVTCGVTV
ncbi:hypothetical protein ACN47E_008276 [Coniothyrium glycines]